MKLLIVVITCILANNQLIPGTPRIDSTMLGADSKFIKQTSEIDTLSDLTASYVIDNYLEAIGGRDLFANVKDRITVMRGTAMEQNISVVVKQLAPNKMRQEIKAGAVMQVTYFDGERGAMQIGDEIIEIKDKELERLKIEATMHLLLDPESYGLRMELEGSESVDSLNCYKLKIVVPSGIRWFQYYDIESGLKIKEQKEIQTAHGLFEQEAFYSDYREVDGLKFPFKIKQSFGIQKTELSISSIKLNSGISKETFEIPD